MCKRISWSTLYRHRQAAAARFGRIERVPLVKRVRDVIAEAARDVPSALEIGAGDRHFQAHLQAVNPGIEYQSLDIDSALKHDYRGFEDVPRTFPLVFALEVIEHLSLDEILPWLESIRAILEPGGRLVLSTPNTYYPPAYLRDATHRTPLCYDELAALLAMAGYRVTRIYRVYNDPLHRRMLRQYAFGWLFRLIGIDFARQIVVVAEPAGGHTA